MTTIIIVDDKPGITRILRHALRGPGRVVEEAWSYGEALAKAEAMERFDVGIIDKNLDDTSGLDLIRELRAPGCDAELILITAYPSVESVAEAVQLGSFDFVQNLLTDLSRIVLAVQEDRRGSETEQREPPIDIRSRRNRRPGHRRDRRGTARQRYRLVMPRGGSRVPDPRPVFMRARAGV